MSTIALALGDPGGIGPEIVARSLSARTGDDDTQVLLVANRDEVELGMQIAGSRFEYSVIDDPRRGPRPSVPVVLWPCSGDVAAPFERARVGVANGRYCIETLRLAVELTVAGVT